MRFRERGGEGPLGGAGAGVGVGSVRGFVLCLYESVGLVCACYLDGVLDSSRPESP